ncbi:MetQ/NlpA family ABC transporter substrate-binding protein [Curtobacterium sp. ME26]|uniref:MetQ/NlpA family ABC transporter substrate-binding protein n=1 Tax=Curtobacterium sp. ME26 TaxID=2744254 RepID=UPI0015F6F709|nr:MetQ/NlpA family ABC transporter substrate-binding protein [Curtobacterium sp. ME26]
MDHPKRALIVSATVVIAALTLSACASGSTGSSEKVDGKWTASSEPLRVWAENRPHSEILEHIQDAGLLPDGVTLDVTVAQEGVNENETVENGDVDATYIDHVPFFEQDTKQRGITDLEVDAKVHIEPLGIYSKKVTSVDDIPDGATIGIPDNVTNFARGLFLLQSAGLLKLDRSFDGGDLSGDDLLITEANITSNPKHLKFLKTADNTQLARQLQDVDAAILQGNAALGVDLTPSQDALQLEDSKNGNPYVNVLIAPKALHDDPRIEALDKALTSKEIADWITKTYKGSVIPVNHVE